MIRKFFVILAITFTYLGANSQQLSFKTIVSEDLSAMVKKDKNIVLLDVRTPGEFNAGYIKGAVNMDISQPGAAEAYLNLDKKKTYIIYCRTKNRSGVVAQLMAGNGFSKIYQMTDGIVIWTQKSLPLEKPVGK